MFPFKRSSVFVCLVVSFLVFASPVRAATRTWTGAVSSLWSVGGNWSGGVAPVDGDDLVFPGTAVNPSPVNDIAGLTIGSISFPSEFPSVFVVYNVTGNGITVTGGITSVCCVGTWNVPITLGASQLFDINSGLRFDNIIELAGHTLTIDPFMRLNGSITGAGNVLVQGEGQLLVEGSISITGTVALTSGADLNVNGSVSAAAMTAGSDSIVSGDGVLPATTLNAAVIRPGEESGGIADPHHRAILTTGTFSMTGGTLAIDLVNSTPGTGHDQLVVNGSVTLNTPALQVHYPGAVPPPGTSFVILANDGADPVIGTFAGLPEGTTFAVGPTSMQITYTGGTGNDVVVTVFSGPKSWTGAVNNLWSVGGNWTDGVAPVDGDDLVFTGDALNPSPVNDIAGLTLGSLSFPNGFESQIVSYNFTGNAITLTEGIAAAGDIGIWNIPITLVASQLFDVNGGLRFDNTIALAGHTLTIDPSFDLYGSITGPGDVLVQGQGLFRVEGSVAIAGAVSVTADADITVHGSISAAALTVGNDSIISGDGTLPPTTLTSAFLRPGDHGGGMTDPEDPGILTIGTLVMSGGSFGVDLISNVPGSGHDQLVVNGTVTLLAPTLQINEPAAFPPMDSSFIIIANDGTDPIIGTFAGLPEGAVFVSGGTSFRITYTGGTGNDVALTIVNTGIDEIPTLNTWMLLLLTVAIAVIGFRITGR